jgi:prephenate dehydrogenase
VLDRVGEDPKEILPLADVIILAAPVSVIIEYLTRLPDILPGGAMVLDIGSTKAEIVRHMQALPSRFDPIGGHPMCGKEVNGLANADAQLFRGATFAFTPLERTSDRARSFCSQLATAIGAQCLWLTPDTHDRWTAATSHFPYLLANTLASVTPVDAAPLVGPGFRSTARLAASSPRMMRDILATNAPNILASIAGFKSRLEQLESLIRENDLEALEALFAAGADQYSTLTSSRS